MAVYEIIENGKVIGTVEGEKLELKEKQTIKNYLATFYGDLVNGECSYHLSEPIDTEVKVPGVHVLSPIDVVEIEMYIYACDEAEAEDIAEGVAHTLEVKFNDCLSDLMTDIEFTFD